METQKCILVIDDNRTVRNISQGVLEKNGYRAITAASGKEGIEMVQQSRPDLILLDIILPDMDGYDVCRWLKADKNTKKIPIIFLTSKGRIDQDKGRVGDGLKEIEKGFECGAIDFLSKPIAASKLVKSVKNALWVSQVM